LAILPFENLTSDPAGTIAAAALRLAIWDSLQAQPALHVTLVPHRRDLPELQPVILLEGYADQGRFQLQLAGQTLSCAGPIGDCAPKLAAAVASGLSVTPRALPRTESLLLLADPAQNISSLEAAAKADPNTSAIWLHWAARVQRADGAPAALAVLSLAPVASMAHFDAARVRLSLAELRRDRVARAKSLVELAALSPADLELQDRAAREATSVRDLDSALAVYRRTLPLFPSPPILNQAAYTAAFAGDRAAAENYAASAQAAAPADPRYLDTRGDIAYFFGQFSNASQFFEQASAMNIAFLNGIDLWKAADAARRSGDSSRAASLLARYLDFQTRSGRHNTLVLQATWAWFAGADEDAIAKLRTAMDSTERGKSLFYLTLAALNRKDLGAAQSFLRQLDPNTIESALLGVVINGTPQPPGLPVPPEALTALNRYVHGDNKGAKRSLDLARTKMDPIAEGQWRKLDAILSGGKDTQLLPPSPDDWLAFLLR
jgi:tetratricopeptide (TPR) repeat protein